MIFVRAGDGRSQHLPAIPSCPGYRHGPHVERSHEALQRSLFPDTQQAAQVQSKLDHLWGSTKIKPKCPVCDLT